MFNYLGRAPDIQLPTRRLLVRLAQVNDARLVTAYYAENRYFLKSWEPTRDESYYHETGWHTRLVQISRWHKQQTGFCFLLLNPQETEIYGMASFTGVVRGAFQACYLGYSLGQRWQGQGLMFEALQRAIQYLQHQQNIRRIMANYMPHNLRSGALLQRLGFQKEGYARGYLHIDGKWQDHILTALVWPGWQSGRI